MQIMLTANRVVINFFRSYLPHSYFCVSLQANCLILMNLKRSQKMKKTNYSKYHMHTVFSFREKNIPMTKKTQKKTFIYLQHA